MLSEYRINVLSSFKRLENALLDFERCFCEEDRALPGWFNPPLEFASSHLHAREQACQLIKQIEYLNTQDSRESIVAAGLFAASHKTIEAIEALNIAKDCFKTAILNLKSAKISLSDPYLREHFENLFNKRPTNTAALRKMGLSRLHLKQCYRHIHYLPRRPQKVSWSWANTRAITRVTVEDAEKMLIKNSHKPGFDAQLCKLYTLPKDEPLAIVQKLAPHLRANVVLPAEEPQDPPMRLMVKGPLPLFYLALDDKPLPVLRPPGPKRTRNRTKSQRVDTKLDPDIFLPVIHVHRYFSKALMVS